MGSIINEPKVNIPLVGNTIDASTEGTNIIIPAPPVPQPTAPGWDLTGTINPSISSILSSQTTTPSDGFITPDGSKLFIISEAPSAEIYQYSVSGDIGSLTYDNISFSVAAQQSAPKGITFSGDGLHFYIIGTSPVAIHQYVMPSAYDIDNASYVVGSAFDMATEDNVPSGVWVNADESRIYTIGQGNSPGRRFSQFDMTIPGDPTTITFGSRINVNLYDTLPTGLYLKPDESVAMFTGSTGDYVYQLAISTIGDVFTSVLQKQYPLTLDLPSDVFFGPDGRNMYVIDSTTASVHQYALPEPQTYSEAVILKAPIAFWELGDLDTSAVVVDTISGYNGTRVGTTTFGVPGLIPSEPNTALLLPGPSADRINLPDIAALRPATNITIEMIFDLDNTGGDNLFKMASGNNGDSSGWGVTITGGTRVDFYLATVGGNNANGNPNSFLSASAVVTINGPYLVTCTYDGSIRRIYVNGFEVQTGAKSGAIKYGPVSGLAEAPYIGAHAFNGALTGTGLDGVIQYVALYDRVLTPEEVLDNHGARF